MLKTILLTILTIAIIYPSNAQYEAKNKILDEFIQEGMKDWKIPGMISVVVKDGKVVFQKAYGVKDIRTKAPVNDQTLFSMASTTKAVVAIALGMLVDQGKVAWQDKVVKHVPEFKLNNIYTTSEARVVDLLTHNLGIKNTDKIWVWDSLSTTDAMQRYSHAKSVYPLRGGFSYQNMMYIIAGEVITRASGMDWRTFIEKNIFAPLGMNHSATNAAAISKHGNHVTPHVDDYEDGLVAIPLNFTAQVGAAGAIWSSAEDMGKYISFLTNKGIANGDTLLKPKTFAYLFKSHAFVSATAYSTYRIIKPNFHTYGLGWFQHDYRGEKLDFHTGSLAGLVAITGVMHRKKTAVYFFANLGSANLRHAILYKVMDLYAFDDEKGIDWHQKVLDIYSKSKKRSISRQKKKDEARIKDTKPNFSLDKYVGKYRHEMFGEITVKEKNGKLYFDLNKYTFYTLHHWHYNTFRSNKNPEWRYRVHLNFPLNVKGKIEKVQYSGPYINLDFDKVK
jgi:CubicO group peptidase (beta-lactamase class C family)